MKIGQIRGIDLRLSIFLLPLFLVYYLLDIWEKALMVFGIIIAHEIGHVIAALYFGLKVKTIELFPFGGVARVENVHAGSLVREITLSLAGPLVNFLLGGVFWLAFFFHIGNSELLFFLFQVTIAIGCFNLMPVWPFDGGRILRGALSRITGFLFAARLVSRLGQICAGVFFIYGSWVMYQTPLSFHWWVIAVYLFYINRQEKKLAYLSFMRYLTEKGKEIEEKGFLQAKVLVSMSEVPLERIIERLVPHRYHVICVLDEKGNILGQVMEKTAIRMALEWGMGITMGEVLHKDNK